MSSARTAHTDADSIRDQVRSGYAAVAVSGGFKTDQAPASGSGCCGGGACCGPATLGVDGVAQAIGYAQADLAALPDGANLGLSCGNPTALAALRPGETVVDLGSGGGFDCFVAGPRVGPAGRVIGVDMTPEMLLRARRNLAAYRRNSGLDNVEFRLGEIESLPVADAAADVVISNCVLNLSPDKPRVWREIARVLKPGGRVAVSDLALLRPLPESIRTDVEALIGCIAGAALVADIEKMMAAAGLQDIRLTPKPGYVEALVNSADPLFQKIIANLPPGAGPEDYVTSLDISARRGT